MADVHGVCIHDPRHDLLVGVDVRTENIFLRTQQLHQLRGVTPRKALEFTFRHPVGIANHSSGRAAERDVHHGALPGHPAGQSASLVQGDVGGVTDAALGRPAIDRMLHPEPGKYFQLPIVQLHRDMNDNLPAGLAQYFPQALVELELLRGHVGPRNLRFPRIHFFQICSWHAIVLPGPWQTVPGQSQFIILHRALMVFLRRHPARAKDPGYRLESLAACAAPQPCPAPPGGVC